MSEMWDVVVIGGGPAGENAADYAIRDSDRTAVIVEAELLGGECSYWACMPSKALLRPLDVAAAANHLGGLRPTVDVDPEALLARRDSWVSQYDDSGQVDWAKGAGIDVVRGRGRLAGERRVEVTAEDGTTRVLEARHAVVLATGSVPVVPSVLAALNPWTSREATGVTEVPARLAIVGGGVVACESARWLRALGAEVTMLVRGDQLLAHAEPFAGELVRQSLGDAGVIVRSGVEVTGAERHDDRVVLDLGGETLEVDEVLVAAGRRPATDGLGLDVLDLTDDDLHGRTSGGNLPDWLHTVGDVNAEAPLTHWGKHQARHVGRLVAARAEGREEPVMGDAPVPQVVFTDPQVAWVGLTEAAARDAGVEVTVRDADYTSASGAALLRDDAAGQARLVLDADEVLVGATFVGPEVAELLHSATVAIVGGLDVATLRRAVPSYPTASEVWLRLLE
jgi:dihydrolipoamide dehydrogenase